MHEGNAVGRMRGLRLLLVLTTMVAAAAIIPATAGATFGISGFALTPSTTQAASHPNVNIKFNRLGTESEDLKTAVIDLPAGMLPNPEAANNSSGIKCTATQFNADLCPGTSQVGTVSSGVTAASIMNITIPGTIYMLEPNPDDVATIGMILRPSRICILWIFCAQPSKVFLKTNVKLHTFDSVTNLHLKTITTDAPTTTTVNIPLIVTSANLTLDITIKSMSLNFQSKSGPNNDQKYFMLQSASCQPSISNATLTSYAGATASATSSYTPTGCGNVPFDPTMSFTPANTNANAASATSFTLNIPQADAAIQNAPPQIVDEDFPDGSGVDLGQLSGVIGCTEVQLRADSCLPTSVIGSSSSVAPYLPPALTGTVYAMEPITSSVPLAVVLHSARGGLIIFRGTLGVRTPTTGASRAFARFDSIPQLPYASITVNIAKPVYKNPNPSVCGTQTTTGHLLAYNGSTAPAYTDGTTKTITSTYTLTGCNPAPETTVTAGPPSTSSVVTPSFSYASSMTGSSFVCQLDTQPAVPCNDNNVSTATATTGSYTSAALANGSHTFSVFAVNGVTSDATPATLTFNISTTFTITPTVTSSTTISAAHPNLSLTADIAGGQPASITIKMPDGFAASLASRPLCSPSDAAAGACLAASSIGVVSLTLNKFGGPETGVGTAYLTSGPTPADAGGISIKVPFSFGTFIGQGGAYLVSNGKNQLVNIRNIPATVGTTAVNVTQLKIDFAGATNRLLTNATSCAPSAFIATGAQTDGVGASPVSTPYQSTGCSATVPSFSPTLNQTLTNPVAGTDTTPGLTGVVANVSLPADSGSIKTFVTKEPAFLVPNYNAYGAGAYDQCTAGSIVNTGGTPPNYVFNYSAANCPTPALVGTMTINTPLLSTPLVGKVYLVNRGSLPSFGVTFDQPGISIRLVGMTRIDSSSCDTTVYNSGCPDQIQVTFDNMPDTPISSVIFALNNPDRPNYNNTATLSGNLMQTAQHFDTYICRSPSPASSTVTSSAAQAAVLSQPLAITGCDPQP